tara:strand:- start:48260 stop:49228 length:969 start_codon:yes stop_codon:yes gene_type:complete
MKDIVDKNTKFRPVDMWAKIPMGVSFAGDATSVAVDSKDNVYVFNRGNHPIAIFDKNGNFLRGLGHGDFIRPHGIEIDADDNLYLVDDDGHFVQKRNNDGEILFTIGEKGKPCEWQSGGMFNRPTDIAIDPLTRDLFVSDGYGNSRIHKFDSDGKHIISWGEPGTEPGQFSLPHNITMVGKDKVAVCDRENFRIQFFSTKGEFVNEIHIHHPMSITEGKNGDDKIYVGEMLPPPVQQGVPNLGAKVSILDSDGNIIKQIGDSLPGEGLDQFTSPHGISTDSNGSIYVAEVAWTAYFSKPENSGLEILPLGEVVSLRKWIKVN